MSEFSVRGSQSLILPGLSILTIWTFCVCVCNSLTDLLVHSFTYSLAYVLSPHDFSGKHNVPKDSLDDFFRLAGMLLGFEVLMWVWYHSLVFTGRGGPTS